MPLSSKTRTPLLSLAALLAALLVASAVIHYVADTHDSSRNGQPVRRSQSITGVSAAKQQRLHYGEIDLGVAYGWTREQVRAEIGARSATEKNCWIYRGPRGKIRGRYSLDADAMKYCFSAGPAGGSVMTHVSGHYPAHTVSVVNPKTGKITRKHYPAMWGGTVTLLKVPDWYKRQNS